MSRMYTIYVVRGCIWQLCLFIILGTSQAEVYENQCKLCNSTYNSCAMQFPKGKFLDEDCRMKYYERNSTACSSLELSGNIHGSEAEKVVLQSYLLMQYNNKIAALNVSFNEFSKKSITMRYMQNGNPKKNSCRSFQFSENFLATKPTSLFYDCLWSYHDYEDKTFNFEYLASDDISSVYGKYVFIVPRWERIDFKGTKLKNWQVFMYVDISNSPSVILRAQTVPKKFNVTTYRVTVYSGTEHDKIFIDEKMITVSENDDEFLFNWHLGIYPRNYFFTVQPLSNTCDESGCFISKSPYLMIEPSPYLICIGILSGVIIIVILVIVVLKYTSQDGYLTEKPKLLLIYRSTHSSHVKVVSELAQHLRENCNIEAMVDELDVNKSETHDPFYWYNDAVSQANFIAIVSSPNCCNSICGIYPQVDKAALGILRGKGFQQEMSSSLCNLMVFLLPYCSEKNLPPEAKNIGLRFNIPYQINEVMNYVIFINKFRRKYFVGRLYYWLRRIIVWNFKYEKETWKKCPQVYAAIEDATAEVSKCLARGNKGEFENLTCGSDKKISKIRDDYSEPNDIQPSKFMETISESSILTNTQPYGCFPGNIDDYDLSGNNSAEFEKSESKPEKKFNFLLDDLDL